MKWISTILILFCLTNVDAQLNYKTLRYEEDYSRLKDDTSASWYKQMKYCALSANNNNYLSFGGDIRYQYFRIRNEKWGDEPKDKDGYVFSRLLVHGDLHLGKHFRLFSQVQSSMVNGKLSTSPVDENPLDLHQAFIESGFSSRQKVKWFVRIGRQELAYGSQRLMAVRDGPNNRQSFDAVKIGAISANTRLDFFYSNYVRSRKGLFNDRYDKDIRSWGAYLAKTTNKFLPDVDFYYLGLFKKAATFTDGQGTETRHSIGARIFSKPKRLRYDIEGLYQFGSFNHKKIGAWTLSFNTGYQFIHSKLKPEIGLKTELISGDRSIGDNKLQTFNPYFPRGGYFGLASLIGPSNLFDIHPSLGLWLSKRLQLNVDADIFWRYSVADGIYGPNVALIYNGINNSYRKIGNQVAADFSYSPNAYLYFRLEYTWFDAGDFLKASGQGKDILFGGITAQLKF